jgi:hypothetical protein
MRLGTVLFALAFCTAVSVRAQAQTGARKWEIDFHAGGAFAGTPTGGSGQLPAPGAAFTTLGGRPSRQVPSWYFGDGALLANQVYSNPVTPPVTAKITALDPVLNSTIAERQSGGSFGFRVGRWLTPRITVEFTLDYSSGHLAFTSTNLAGIEATRASFGNVWGQAFSNTAFSQVAVSSTAEIHDKLGHQLLTTGAVDINLTTTKKFQPYLVAGAGVLTNGGDTPSLTLTGSYDFMFGGTTHFRETDTVRVRMSLDTAFVGLIGGGARYFVTPRWGLRVELREHLMKNSVTTLVDATPAAGSFTPVNVVFSNFGNPAIQFSNNPATNLMSSLSGPAVNGFKTFSRNAADHRTDITGGVFFRF